MKITLKDGSSKEYASAMSIYDIALDISEGLARVACAGEVDGEVVDLRTVVDKDCTLNILTAKDEAGLKVLRHTCSHVMDHAKAIDMVQEQGKLFETYNIGGHNEKQNIEIINIIIDTLNEMLPDSDPRKAHINRDLITYVEDRKGHDRRYAIAPDKIKKDLGWEPETMFKDGIKLTIAWFFEHEDWMKNVTSGDYQKYYSDMYDGK